MTKKILIVTQSEGGGLRRHLTDLMDGLIEQNFEVVLAYNEEFGDNGFKRWLEIKKASQSLILYNVSEMKRSISPLDDFLAIKRLMQIIRDEQPDIVHTHSSKAGVSESPVAINTRMVLEKGITLAGTTRSSRSDFETAINLVANNQAVKERLELLVQNVKQVTEVKDIASAFDEDLAMNWGKTVLDWQM